VSEGVSVGTTVLTVRAADEDVDKNGEIEYSFLDFHEAFAIDRLLGSIITKASLDRENVADYKLYVLAIDGEEGSTRRTATAIVEITILGKELFCG